jgi:hypothetical protein
MADGSADHAFNPLKRKADLVSEIHGTEFIRIVVGPQNATFSIHKGLLIAASPYFARVLDNAPDCANPIRLEKHSPTTFKVAYQWLYLGEKVPLQRLFPAAESSYNATDTCANPPLFWLELLLLADELEIPVLQRYAYEEFYNLFDTDSASEECATKVLVAKAFDPKQPQAVIQDYLVDHTAHQVFRQVKESRALADKDSWSETFEFGIRVLDRMHELSLQLGTDESTYSEDAWRKSYAPRLKYPLPADTVIITIDDDSEVQELEGTKQDADGESKYVMGEDTQMSGEDEEITDTSASGKGRGFFAPFWGT